MEYSMIIFLLLIAVIIPAIERRKRAVLIKHIIDKKKNSKEKNVMKELAKQFIGKECIIYTVTSSGDNIQGIITDIADGGIIVQRKDSLEAVNLEYVTRIREYPRNAKGKKKTFFA